MNGKTDIDATLNPCTAEMDRRTYGFKWLSFSRYGKRFIWLNVFGINIDLYRFGMCKPMYVRCYDYAMLWWFFGCVSWPMPIKKVRK